VNDQSEPSPERVLVLTPTGRDAEMVREHLLAAGLPCETCEDLDSLLASLKAGTSVAVVAQEGLPPHGAEALLAVLDAQEPWSDVPVLILTGVAPRRARHAHPAVTLLERANVMLLQRPLRLQLFLGVVRSAVRARRRQYQMRDLYRELSRALQLSDMFVAILGHDLRSPLGAIRMAAEIIVRGSKDAHALRPAGRIMTSADRMARMIEQLLDFARVRQGRGIALQPTRANIAEICRPVLQELEDANPDATIELVQTGDMSGVWDPDRVAQVVSNLAGNAVQHGVIGKPITVQLDGANAAVVRLRIENHGVIPAEVIPTLFEAFTRAAPSSQHRTGLGLGLFIAREIVRAHGGEVTVQTSDELTAFEVVLPREARPVETSVTTLA
jgi:signal transduction histidine kinase